MKKRTKLLIGILMLVVSIGNAQDIIVKLKGDSIKAKVLEVGTSTVSYKKENAPNGATFTIYKSEILFIKFANGDIQEFMDETVNTQVNNSSNAVKDSIKANEAANNGTKNKIELLDEKYYINGIKSKRKDVDHYLGQSKNPAIQLQLKGAMVTGKAQQIMKITSYPTTIAGSFTSLFTLVNVYQLKQRGRLDSGSVWKMAFSMFGTAAFPITSKILKKQSDKKYRKLIDMYNETN